MTADGAVGCSIQDRPIPYGPSYLNYLNALSRFRSSKRVRCATDARDARPV